MATLSFDEIRQIFRDDLLDSARWRREKAKAYPDDFRNVEAAEMLEGLAQTVSGMSEDVLMELDKRFSTDEDTAIAFIEAQSEVLRSIGFRAWPDEAEDVARQIIDFANGVF